jgi:hypothetical protein
MNLVQLNSSFEVRGGMWDESTLVVDEIFGYVEVGSVLICVTRHGKRGGERVKGCCRIAFDRGGYVGRLCGSDIR